MDLPTSFGLWLKQRRKQLDLTQAALAGCVGCTIATIRKIEAEERRPSGQVAALLATCLQIPAEQQSLFTQIARGKLRVGQLGKVSSVPRHTLTLEHLLPPPRSNLPHPPTPLLGREQELNNISALVHEPQCQLVTLIGSGGIGKTRLALQIAAQLKPNFAHGAAFVYLAPVVNREQMVTAIADALGFVLYGATDRAEQLFHYLREKNLLLILDNIEHLLANTSIVALVNDLLSNAPAVKMLVTSREPLHLQLEWVYEVEGLPVPLGSQPSDLLANSAAQLFLQRAQRARTAFSLTSDNGPAILRICQLVEGLPLGIELAAAWVLALSCQEIAQELERDLDFLEAPTRDIPERHRSINAVFDYSWDLLSIQEQQVLQQLAVFEDSFSREAAEEIAGATLPILSALVAKSLLRRTDTKAGRYDLHELVRQYVLRRLKQNEQEYIQVCHRHCRYYMALLARRGVALKETERTAVVAELITDIANLRQAWNWATTHQQADMVSQAADTLFWLYESRSNCREGVPLFGQAVDNLKINGGDGVLPANSAEQMQRLALGQVLGYQGFFCFRQGQHPQGRELLQRSLALLQTLSDDSSEENVHMVQAALSNMSVFLGTVISVMGDYSAGHRLLREGLSMKQTLDDRWGAAFCLRQLGLSAYYLGEYSEAHRLLNESLSLSREMGNTWAVASSLNLLSLAAFAQGNFPEAQQLLREGLAHSQDLEDRYNIAVSLNGLGLVSQALGDGFEAERFFRESIAIWREIGDDGDLAETLNNLGYTLMANRELPEAEQSFLEALLIAQKAEVVPIVLNAVLGLAHLRSQAGAPEAALALLPHILQHPASPQETKDRAAQLNVELSAQLPLQQVTAIQTHANDRLLQEVVTDILK